MTRVGTAGPALALTGSGLGGRAFAVALRTGDAIADAAAPVGTRVDLAVLARDLLRQHAVGTRDLREIRVDRGPGSYVGLRVAVTFARFLAAGYGARLLVADSLAVAAIAAITADATLRERRLHVAVDARQQRVAAATFTAMRDHLDLVQATSVVDDTRFGAMVAKGDVVLAEPAVRARVPAHQGAEVREIGPISASALFAPELPILAVEPGALEPVYLSGSYVGEA